MRERNQKQGGIERAREKPKTGRDRESKREEKNVRV